MNTPLEQLQWRYATKQFDTEKKISEQDLHVLTECLRLSPSSFGLQPWKFIVVQDSTVRSTLREHSWGQAQITDASHIVVHCARKTVDTAFIEHYVETIRQVRSNPNITDEQKNALEAYKQLMIGTLAARTPEQIAQWAKQQVYISQGMLIATAAQMSIDTCPMEGFDSNKYDKLLGLEDTEYTSTLVTALGYRSSTDQYAHLPKVRFCAEEVITIL